MCGGSGIPQVKGELRGRMHQNWWRIILTKLAGGIMAIGAGLSLGREGPSIQIGAMLEEMTSYDFGRFVAFVQISAGITSFILNN